MDRIRKLVQLFTTIALMALALPSAAADKQYIATVQQTGLGTSAVTITNDPTGNSLINSLWIRVSGSATLTSQVKLTVRRPNGNVVATYFATPSGQYAEFINIVGYRPGYYAVIESVNNIECFTLGVFTGNTLGGTHFAPSTTTPSDPRLGCDAYLGCGDFATFVSGQNTTVITRATSDKLDTECDPVALKVLFSDFDNRVEIKWQNPNVFLTVDVTWPYSLANPLTTLPYLTKSTWENDSSGNPIIIPAPACRTNDLPVYVAPLATDPYYPFPIIDAAAKLPDGTPHPYAGNGTPVRVCLVNESFAVQSYDNWFNNQGCPQPTTAVGCYRKTTRAYMNNDPLLIGR